MKSTNTRYLLAASAAALLFFALAAARQASPQDHSLPSAAAGHEGMDMATDEPIKLDAAQQLKLLADKKESEFNHHLAGFFVILAGVFIFVEHTLSQRSSFLR